MTIFIDRGRRAIAGLGVAARKNRAWAGRWPVWAASLCALAGCMSTQPTTRPSSAYQRAEDALRDPFGYSPQIKKSDVSGGGIGEFDREGFGKDIKDVIDP